MVFCHILKIEYACEVRFDNKESVLFIFWKIYEYKLAFTQ